MDKCGNLKCAILALLAIFLTSGAFAFPCRTSFGLVEIPGTPGFAPGDNVVKKIIQRTKKALGGQNGKVVSVLVREEELGQQSGYTEMVSLSQTSIEVELSESDFEQIVAGTRAQILSLSGQSLQGMKFGGFQAGNNYYCNTLEIHAEGAAGAEAASAFTVMGGVLIKRHLYSIVAHTSHARDEASRNAWVGRCKQWIEKLVAENGKSSPASSAPILATVPNVDDYAMAGLALEKTERVRTKGRGGPEALDVRIEHPKSMKEVAAPGGTLLALERVVDGYAFRMEASETHYDAALDAALDAFAAAKGDAAKAMAAQLAPRLAAADGEATVTLDTGVLAVDGRNAVWRDTWRPAPPGASGSGCAVKTLWLQADGCRAFKMEFTLRDTTTPLIPVADLKHFNAIMAKTASETTIQNKKQFKKK